MHKWFQTASSLNLGLILFAIGFLIYFFSLFNGFVADDNVYILENPQIRNFNLTSFFLGSSYYSGDVTQLSGIYYKPVFTLVTSLLFNISSGTPHFIRFVQIIIHLTNSFLIFLFFKHFFSKKIAYILAIIFLIHPGNTESVIYIADLQDVLFFLFGISALLVSLKQKLTYKSAALLSLFLLLSLLSKESGILFLPTTLLLALTLNKQNTKIIAIVISAVFSIYIFMRIGIAQVTINHQSIAPIMDAPFLTRLLTIPKIIYSYLLLFIFPKDLSWGQHWVISTPTPTNFYLPLLLVLLVLLLLSVLLAPASKLRLLVLLTFLPKKQKITLSFFLLVVIFGFGLHSQLIPLDFTFAERWFYFPLFGLLGICGVISQQIKFNKSKEFIALGTVFIIIVLLSARTFFRTLNWYDDYTLSTHDLQIDPYSFALENNLGFELIKKNQFEEAKNHLENSIKLYPSKSNVSAYNNAAFTYAKLGQSEKAVDTYKKALSLGEYYVTYQNYIAELIRQQKYPEAETTLKDGLSKYPNNPKLYLLLAVIEYKTGNTDKAITAAQKANSLTPGIGNFVLLKIQKKEPINL